MIPRFSAPASVQAKSQLRWPSLGPLILFSIRFVSSGMSGLSRNRLARGPDAGSRQRPAVRPCADPCGRRRSHRHLAVQRAQGELAPPVRLLRTPVVCTVHIIAARASRASQSVPPDGSRPAPRPGADPCLATRPRHGAAGPGIVARGDRRCPQRRDKQDETPASIRVRRGSPAWNSSRATPSLRSRPAKKSSETSWRRWPVGQCLCFPESKESAGVPGRHVTDCQKRLFMKLRKTHTTEVAAAKAWFSRVTGYREAGFSGNGPRLRNSGTQAFGHP